MAIYSFIASTASRGNGVSAGARSDYINREQSYSNKNGDVLDKHSGNMPQWAEGSPREYWTAADTYERVNARLFKQVIFALPNELTPDQQKDLSKEFAKQLAETKDGPLPYSYAVHNGHDNPHCHLMISERVNDGHSRSRDTWFKRAGKEREKGGARKTEALKSKDWLLEARAEWQAMANQALEKAGHESRIDHRTLKAQGIDREPTKHRGPALNAMLRSGKLKLEEVKKNLKPTKDKEKMKTYLRQALRLKELINAGMAGSNKEFNEEKIRQEMERRAQEERKFRLEDADRLKAEALAKSAREEKEHQLKREREEPRQKSRGTGYGR